MRGLRGPGCGDPLERAGSSVPPPAPGHGGLPLGRAAGGDGGEKSGQTALGGRQLLPERPAGGRRLTRVALGDVNRTILRLLLL